VSLTLHLFTLLTAAAGLFLIVAGGLVTSTGSGLAVPDWPLSYGQVFPPMVGGIFYEHGHRMVATVVGLLTLVQAVWLWRSASTKALRWLGVASLVAVIVQGTLGGLTVLFLLPVPVSAGHAVLGQTFFCLLVTIALLGSKSWRESPRIGEARTALPLLAAGTTLAIYLQLALGALVRHTNSALAIPDFPLSFGQWIPPVFTPQVAIQFAHRVWGSCVGVLALITAAVVFVRHREARLRIPAGLLAVGAAVQITLGAYTVWTGRSVAVATAHVAVGAALLATALVLTLLAVRRFGWGGAAGALRRRLRDYGMLTKPRITLMVCVTGAAGFFLASPEVDGAGMGWTLLAMALVASGASALNQYAERRIDALMHRTADRPLPAERMSPPEALAFGLALTLGGLALFAFFVNAAAAGAALFTWISYLFVYTPLKRVTHHATWIGAIPGAMPPVIGWLGASGAPEPMAGVLFAILFLWQIPHFFSIGWLYRDDYARASLPILPVIDPSGVRTGRQAAGISGALFAVALVPHLAGAAGGAYLAVAILAGALYLRASVRLLRHRSLAQARQVLLTSVLYLPAVFFAMAADRL
jgi:protoheme IX farnesyltransferase